MSSKATKPKKVNPFRLFLNRRYAMFMEAKGTEGSYVAEWKEFEREAIATDPEVRKEYETFAKFGYEIGWDQTWRTFDGYKGEADDGEIDGDEAPRQLTIFSIGGWPVKPVQRFHDEVPGGYRSVFARHATVAALLGQAQVTAEQGRLTVAAAERQLKQANEALRRSGGVASALAFNVRDDDAEPGYGEE